MGTLRLFLLAAAGALAAEAAALPPRDLAWMRGSVGVSFHWTAAIPSADGAEIPFEEAVAGFDAEGLADTLQNVGARHLIFTLAHAWQMLPMPNAALDRIAPGRTCRRDLFGDIIRACAAREIRVIAYYNHGCNNQWNRQTPDPAIARWIREAACPTQMGGGDMAAFATNLCAIVRDISLRYGKGISGWWLDSPYSVDSSGPHRALRGEWRFPWQCLIDAARAGNPDAAVAINGGVGVNYQYADDTDYYAGETVGLDDPFTPAPDARRVDTRWTCFDDAGWTFSRRRGFVPPRLPIETFAAWTRANRAAGRMTTFNVLIDRRGRVSPEIAKLKRVFARVPATGTAERTYVVDDSAAYNAWPSLRALGDKLLVIYSHVRGHEFDNGRANTSLARLSTDGARTWSSPVPFAVNPLPADTWGACGAAAKPGDALVWSRHWKEPERWHTLVKTSDGLSFEPVSRPRLDPMPVQIMEPVALPGHGLVSIWFAGSYHEQTGHSWGLVRSTDGGRSWSQQVVEANLLKADWPTEPCLLSLGGSRLMAIARCEQRCQGNPPRRLFELTSEDGGQTWIRRLTNIGDVLESTPSAFYDAATDELTLYYFQRGPGLLKRRTARAAAVFADATAWSAPRVVAYGRKRRDWDSGNVNAVRKDGVDYLSYYAGNERASSVLVSVVGATNAPPCELDGRRILLLGEWSRSAIAAVVKGASCEARVYPTAEEASLDYEPGAFAAVVLPSSLKGARESVSRLFPEAKVIFADAK